MVINYGEGRQQRRRPTRTSFFSLIIIISSLSSVVVGVVCFDLGVLSFDVSLSPNQKAAFVLTSPTANDPAVIFIGDTIPKVHDSWFVLLSLSCVFSSFWFFVGMILIFVGLCPDNSFTRELKEFRTV